MRFSRTWRELGAALFAAMLAAWPALGQAPVSYQPILEGVSDPALYDLLSESSELFRLADQPPGSMQALRGRALADAERLREVLRAEGYYASKVEAYVEREGEGAVARLRVEPGPVFLLSQFQVLAPRDAPESAREIAAAQTPESLGLKLGAPARSADVVRATTDAVGRFSEQGYPFAELVSRRAIVDHATQTMRVRLLVEPGPFARFGETQIEGLERVSERLVRREVKWREGDVFNAKRVAELRQALSATGLFSSTSIDWPDAPGPDGRLPVRIAVREAEHRSVGVGLSYSTAEGAGAKAFWGHDDLFGNAERLYLEGVVAEQRQSASASLRRPWFLIPEQTLELTAALDHEAFEAYQADRSRVGTTIERQLGDGLSGRAGLALEHSLVEEEGEERVRDTFDLLDAPLSLRYEAADDALDPTSGWRFELNLTPTIGVAGTDAQFVTVSPTGSFYLPVDRDRRRVLALRGRAGVIKGESRRGIPANRRLYAGGGDTVRGYGFQLVGPLDEGGQPIGGAFMVAGTAELRTRLTEKFGFVAFVDAGNVSEDSRPEFDDGLRIGVGVGARYFTPVGPLRLDVAVPLDKRSIDDDFQIYVSFGQAF